MENKNYSYKGWKLNGFVMLLLNLILTFGSIGSIIYGAAYAYGGAQVALVVVGILLLISTLFLWGGFLMLEPNEARVLVFFGEYRGTFYETGYWWINPFISVKKISLRARNLNVDPIKVNDKSGNPVMIGLVLVWKIKTDEVYKAVFDIDTPTADGVVGGAVSNTRMKILEDFVNVQSDAALRQVASCYAYDNMNNDQDEVTLRTGNEQISQLLEGTVSERCAIAGVEIVEARINYLAYAPEIAAVMLRRQQADAIIAAREKIVEGAVSMVQLALDKLSKDKIIELDQERKAAMVSNLLVVLCSDEGAQPVVNTGTSQN